LRRRTSDCFKRKFRCKHMLISFTFFRFDFVQVMSRSPSSMCSDLPTTCYKYVKNFIYDFSDYLAEIMSKYDRVLIIMDFNIHVCCSDKSLVKNFLTLIYSFNLVQCITCPPHQQGNILDFVLSCGL